jgi:hypothetical protein
MKTTALMREHMRREGSARGEFSRGLKLVGVQALANEVGPRGIRDVLRSIVPAKRLSKHMVDVNKSLKEIEALSHSSAIVMEELRQVILKQVMGGGLCEGV